MLNGPFYTQQYYKWLTSQPGWSPFAWFLLDEDRRREEYSRIDSPWEARRRLTVTNTTSFKDTKNNIRTLSRNFS